MINMALRFQKLFKSAIQNHFLLAYHKKSNSNKNFGECNPVKFGIVSPELYVPDHIPKPDYYYKFTQPGATIGVPEIKTSDQVRRMQDSGQLAAAVLSKCEEFVQVGITTDEIDVFVHKQIIAANAYPSPLRYFGFPKSICTSVNNVACHGIPDDRQLQDGDIINVDVTVFFKGCHGDCSKTFLVGNVDERGRFLVKSTEECLHRAISLCGPEVPFQAIGCFISKFCEENSLDVVPEFIGHGIGDYFHGPPEILHYENNLPGMMKVGQTFTIEPILTLGEGSIVIRNDGWTAVSLDGARSAQFEHTILITDNGSQILTNVENQYPETLN